jgi:hypothetical protein
MFEEQAKQETSMRQVASRPKCWFLLYLIFRPSRLRRYVSPKRRLTFNGLYYIYEERDLFVTTNVISSNSTNITIPSIKFTFISEILCWWLLTYLWSWALLEEPPSVLLLSNFPAFYGTRRFITLFTRALYWSLFWARSIQFMPSHPISLRSILILLTHPTPW